LREHRTKGDFEEKQNTLRFPWNKTLRKKIVREDLTEFRAASKPRRELNYTESPLPHINPEDCFVNLTGATQFQSSSPIRFAFIPITFCFEVEYSECMRYDG
jgi:hypothetical protein